MRLRGAPCTRHSLLGRTSPEPASAPTRSRGLIHYKRGYLDRHLTCWQCSDFDTVLLELYPSKMIVEDEDLDDVIPETIAFVTFLAEAGLLDEESDSEELWWPISSRWALPFVLRWPTPRATAPASGS
jgi:hypothetical protein